MGVADVACQHAQVPVGPFWKRKEQIGFRAARPERGDATVRGPEELAGVAEHVSQRLVRLPNVFQMGGEAVDELQRREFSLDRQHGPSGWFSTRHGSSYFPLRLRLIDAQRQRSASDSPFDGVT